MLPYDSARSSLQQTLPSNKHADTPPHQIPQMLAVQSSARILSAWVGRVCPSEILCAVSLVSALTRSSCTLCRWYEYKCKHCSGGKVGDIKTTQSGRKSYPRVNPDCGIMYRVGPYVKNGVKNVTSSRNSGSQVFARLFARLFAQLFVFARLFARLFARPVCVGPGCLPGCLPSCFCLPGCLLGCFLAVCVCPPRLFARLFAWLLAQPLLSILCSRRVPNGRIPTCSRPAKFSCIGKGWKVGLM